ncbi:MAG: DMT family transporter [Nocardioides sp.]
MAILLSLLAAVTYGLSDFLGGVFSKRTSPWAIAFVASVVGGAGVLALSPVLDGSPDRTDLAWALLAGLGNGFGTAFLYRGLSSGRMGVVAPVSGVGAALLPVVVGVLTGERPSPLVWLGIASAVPAIWLVAREPSTGDLAGDGASAAVVNGVLAGLGFGTLFVALAQIPEEAGILPLALNQAIAAVVIVAVASALRVPWAPRDPTALKGALCGVLGASATVLFLLATREGLLTVAAVITSLYPAFTVVLAASVLREHIHRAQAVGLGLCVLAVILVAAG